MCKNTHSLLWLLKRVWAHVETESRDTNQLKSLMKHEVTTLEVQREEQKGGRSKDNSDVKRLQAPVSSSSSLHTHTQMRRVTASRLSWSCFSFYFTLDKLKEKKLKYVQTVWVHSAGAAPQRAAMEGKPAWPPINMKQSLKKYHTQNSLASFHKPDNTEAQRWTVFDFFNNTFFKNEASTKVSKTAVPLMATRGSHSRSVPTDSWVKLEAEIKSVGLILLYNKPTLASVSLITKLFSLIHGLEVRGVVALTDRRSLTAAKWSHCVCAFQSIFNGIV